MKPRISIVTITYNAAPVLQRTLDSVLQQSYPYVEHLIIDGASTDATVTMAHDYKEETDQTASSHDVVIQSEPDNGLYDAMNKGLRLATGDYICFLNAGDSLPTTDTLELMADRLKAIDEDGLPRPAVLYGDTDIVDNDGNFLHHRRLQPPEQLSWRSFRQGMLVCHQAFYARMDLAKQTPYDLQYRYSADVDWCIRIMKLADERGLSLINLHAVVANYTEEGQTTLHHRDSLKERYRVMCRHYGQLPTLFMHLWFVIRAILK